MKFSRLIGKVDKIAEKKRQGQPVKPHKLAELQGLLSDKIDRYQSRLEENQPGLDREKLETRLKVVKAQLQKSKTLEQSG